MEKKLNQRGKEFINNIAEISAELDRMESEIKAEREIIIKRKKEEVK